MTITDPSDRRGARTMTSTIHPFTTSQSELPVSGRATSPAMSAYTLGSNPAESERLRQQSVELHAHALALVDHVDLQPGQSAIDIGCGPSGVLELLSERVGPSGRVVGLDVDPAHVTLARAFANERGLTNVEIVQGDATRTGLEASSFDLVHARTVLVTIPDPTAVLCEMVRLAKPGGWVAGEEADGVLFVCSPPHPAWDRLTELFLETWELDGADIHVGRRLPGLYRHAGLVDVGVETRADVYEPGHSRQTIHPDLVRSMRSKIVARGLISDSELEELDRAVRAHLAEPGTLTVPHLLFSAWGRKPAGATDNEAQA
jgi:SAM-dependent methyltransferase